MLQVVTLSGVDICNECVQLCQDMIGDERGNDRGIPGGNVSPGVRLGPLAAENFFCETCDISYPDTTLADAIAAIERLPGRLDDALESVPEGALRVRPSPEVWSPIEYLCHIRDVMISATVRLYRTRTEEVPSVEPMFNDLRAARFGYAHRKVGAVMAEIVYDATGFLAEVARMPSDGWNRRLRRLPGETRTGIWLVRQTMHEGEHHLLDITRVAEADA
ncbi:DinB family protein [Acidiferrimicrobium sp. IK]|nr:DinB family protein [Acidiferrimicrobium sp. IK]